MPRNELAIADDYYDKSSGRAPMTSAQMREQVVIIKAEAQRQCMDPRLQSALSKVAELLYIEESNSENN